MSERERPKVELLLLADVGFIVVVVVTVVGVERATCVGWVWVVKVLDYPDPPFSNG